MAYAATGRLREGIALNETLLRERRRYGIDALPLISNNGWLLMILGGYEEALRLHRLQSMGFMLRKP